MDESKRSFIKPSVGLLAASGLVGGGAKQSVGNISTLRRRSPPGWPPAP